MDSEAERKKIARIAVLHEKIDTNHFAKLYWGQGGA